MVLCFLGVLLIALFRHSQKSQIAENLSMETVGIVLTFIVAWKQAGINVVNRKLKDVHFAIITFYATISIPVIVVYLIV